MDSIEGSQKPSNKKKRERKKKKPETNVQHVENNLEIVQIESTEGKKEEIKEEKTESASELKGPDASDPNYELELKWCLQQLELGIKSAQNAEQSKIHNVTLPCSLK